MDEVVLNCWVTDTKLTPRGIECLDNLGKISQTTGEAVYLTYNDGVDLLGIDIREQAFEPWTLHGSARIAAIVVVAVERAPSFLFLAEDVRLAGLTLGIKRVEGLFEPFFGRFAGVNRAADGALLT